MTDTELKTLTEQATAGNAEAQYEIGCYYRDLAEEKLNFFKSRIPSGNPNLRAPYNFVEKDHFTELVRGERETAFGWLQKAAEQGLPEAIYALSLCHREGTGTAPFPKKADELLLKAAEMGYAVAQYDLAMQFYFGRVNRLTNAVEIAQDYAQAVRWLQKAAEQGENLAKYYLGLCYEEGTGVKQDFEAAAKWYRSAAEAELSWAACSLGRCLEYGNGVEKDLAEAIIWYQKAAENGDAEAEEALERLSAEE